MAGILERDRPTLLLEINRPNSEAAGSTPEQIETELRKYGYRFLEIRETAEQCRPMAGFAGVDRANVLCHIAELPAAVTTGWTLKEILRGRRPAEPEI